jgi:hypothetical protein
MYKGASRFRQHLSDEGRKLEGPPRRGSKPGKPKTRRVRRIDAAAEEAKLRNWSAYIRTCRENNVEPRVPEDILVKLKRQRLIP